MEKAGINAVTEKQTKCLRKDGESKEQWQLDSGAETKKRAIDTGLKNKKKHVEHTSQKKRILNIC